MDQYRFDDDVSVLPNANFDAAPRAPHRAVQVALPIDRQLLHVLRVPVMLGPLKPIVADRNASRLHLRFATLRDGGLGQTGVGKIVEATLNGALRDGRRVSLLLMQGLLRHASDTVRLRVDDETDRLRLRALLTASKPAVLRCISASLTPEDGECDPTTLELRDRQLLVQWLEQSVIGSAATGELRRVVTDILRASGDNTDERLPCAVVEGPLASSRWVPGVAGVIPFRAQSRFPVVQLTSPFGLLVAVFPPHVVAFEGRSDVDDSSSSSDGEDNDDGSRPLTEPQRVEQCKRFAVQLLEWCRAVGVSVIVTHAELREEVVMGVYPHVRILDGVQRRDINSFLLQCNKAGGLAPAGSGPKLASWIDHILPDGTCRDPNLYRCAHVQTIARACVSVTHTTPACNTGAVLLSAPALEVRRDMTQLLTKAFSLRVEYRQQRVTPSGGPEGLARVARGFFDASMRVGCGVDASVGRWWGTAFAETAVRVQTAVSDEGLPPASRLWDGVLNTDTGLTLQSIPEPVDHVVAVAEAAMVALAGILGLAPEAIFTSTSSA